MGRNRIANVGRNMTTNGGRHVITNVGQISPMYYFSELAVSKISQNNMSIPRLLNLGSCLIKNTYDWAWVILGVRLMDGDGFLSYLWPDGGPILRTHLLDYLGGEAVGHLTHLLGGGSEPDGPRGAPTQAYGLSHCGNPPNRGQQYTYAPAGFIG